MIQSIEGKCQVSSLVFDVELFVKIFPVASHLSPLVYIIAELIFIPPPPLVCVCASMYEINRFSLQEQDQYRTNTHHK